MAPNISSAIRTNENTTKDLSFTLTDESSKKIDDYELSSNSYMQQGRMTSAYANAMEKAADNSNGAMNGFMGLGVMNMATGGAMNGMATNPWTKNTEGSTIDLSKEGATAAEPQKEETWKCECGHENPSSAKFCAECGKPKPVAGTNKCPKCGAEVSKDAKFCGECGEKLQ